MNKISWNQDSLEALSNAEFAAKLLLYMMQSHQASEPNIEITSEELSCLLQDFNFKEQSLGAINHQNGGVNA